MLQTTFSKKYYFCDIVIYKKFIFTFGHSEDQNIFFLYIWSLPMVPGS